jgi:DNA (cytosine-5)-methyltransferase 1
MRCVSLFSGCGGLDLGLRRAGFKIVLGVDSDPHCAASHAANFPGTPFYTGSVGDIDAALLQSFGAHDNIDLLAGGPPCPPFSKSRFYRKSKPRALSDRVGRETMAGYLKVLGILRPRAFLLENVAGLAYKVHREALQLIQTTAERLGYRCAGRVVNAANYGVPQIRERFLLVGVREGTFRFPPPTHARADKETLFSHNDGLPRWRTAGEAIGDLDTEENADDSGHFAGGKHHETLKLIPPGDNYLFFTKERGHPAPRFKWRSRYWSYLLKLSPEMPSWTIQARRSNNMGPFHWRGRILRIAEVKRLQTFPDDWHLSGTIERQWRQVGNAVPALLAERIGRALARGLSHHGPREKCPGLPPWAIDERPFGARPVGFQPRRGARQ